MSDRFLLERYTECLPLPFMPPGFQCQLPARDEQEAMDFLLAITPGSGVGLGAAMRRMGVDIPLLRAEYGRLADELAVEAQERLAAGAARDRGFARWVVDRRTAAAKIIRSRQGFASAAAFEIRDLVEYGVNGRSFESLEKRMLAKGLSQEQVYSKLIQSAVKPNKEISKAMFKSAKYLKNGGLVTLVITLPTTAHALLTAPEGELGHVAAEQGGSIIGGSLGSSFTVGLCLAFGVASGGWGALACGVLGGAGGGMLGGLAGEQLYYATPQRVIPGAERTGVIDSAALMPLFP